MCKIEMKTVRIFIYIIIMSELDLTEDGELELELESAIYESIDDYIVENILQMADPKFHAMLLQEITEQIIIMWQSHNMLCCPIENNDLEIDDDLYDDIEVIANKMIDKYFELSSFHWDIPLRSHKQFDSIKNVSQTDLANIIEWLGNIPQPVQRTPEWYQFRHGLITASNLAKIFNSDAQCNSLIYEKCQPLIETMGAGRSNIGTNNPMHWGQKYEPVSIMIYESMYNTHVTDFGCIQHPKYPFIGASPDGINCDPEKDRYGRMLEVKNIVNREIDGIPSKAYWIQMQIQMETCDLNECDFLETRFVEYPSLDTNAEQQLHPIYTDDEHGFKGIILYFVERMTLAINGSNGSPHYEYMPLSIPIEIDAVQAWILETRNRLRDQYSLYETKYWYLAEYSCVLVERNRTWFDAALPKIEETWNTILKERVTGYEHRAAKKRVIKTDSVDKIKQLTTGSKSVCLVKLDYPSEE